MRFLFIFIFMFCFQSHAKTNIHLRTSPLSMLLGIYNAEAGAKLNDKLSLAAGFMYWGVEFLDLEVTLQEYHLRADYWFSGTYNQGWYTAGTLSNLSLTLATEKSGVEFEGAVNGLGLLAAGGYHWQWDHFFTEFAGTFGFYSFGTSVELESVGGDVTTENIPSISTLGFEFNLGWVF